MIILINGAPGVGKSTIASAIGKELGIFQIIGTDSIREIIRKYIPEKICPTLHTSAIKAYELIPGDDPDNVKGFIQQSKDILLGVNAVIDRSAKENKDLILEGIHLIPGIIKNDNVDLHIVLTTENEEELKERLMGQGDNRSSYKIENISRAISFQNYLVRISKENNTEVITNDDLEKVAKRIVSYL